MRTERPRMIRWLLTGVVPTLLLGLALTLPAGSSTRAATAPAVVSTAKAGVSTAVSTAKAAASTTVSTAKAGGPTATAVGGGVWPVAIHDGTCANPTTQPAYQLGNLAPYAGSTATAPATGGAAMPGAPVLTVQKTIDVKTSDLVGRGHPRALVLHASAANYTRYLACGDLAGQPTSDDHAVVALRPLGGADWYGIAVLSGSKSVPVVGTNQTQITVYLFQTGGAGTPAA